ncbi:MAG: macrocin O-methyltransferase [Verrucomicrobia bacterium]|nr:macrocin O-methyltransferase [Verrucomicrobiota bacterium]
MYNPATSLQPPVSSHVDRVAFINELEGAALDRALIEVHQDVTLIESGGRNVAAGYVRACGLTFGKLQEAIKKDPLFQKAFHLVRGGTILDELLLMNFFLLLKYGIKERSGDIIEFGSFRGGTAVFLAFVARELGIKGTVYTLDTFEGIPHADSNIDLHIPGDFKEASFEGLASIVKELHLHNLVLIKGEFQNTFPQICSALQPLSLVHVDGATYSSVKYATEAVMPYLHSEGGYLIVDDVCCSACVGVLQAVEEMVQKHNLNAEQTCPHFVYRYAPPQKS